MALFYNELTGEFVEKQYPLHEYVCNQSMIYNIDVKSIVLYPMGISEVDIESFTCDEYYNLFKALAKSIYQTIGYNGMYLNISDLQVKVNFYGKMLSKINIYCTKGGERVEITYTFKENFINYKSPYWKIKTKQEIELEYANLFINDNISLLRSSKGYHMDYGKFIIEVFAGDSYTNEIYVKISTIKNKGDKLFHGKKAWKNYIAHLTPRKVESLIKQMIGEKSLGELVFHPIGILQMGIDGYCIQDYYYLMSSHKGFNGDRKNVEPIFGINTNDLYYRGFMISKVQYSSCGLTYIFDPCINDSSGRVQDGFDLFNIIIVDLKKLDWKIEDAKPRGYRAKKAVKGLHDGGKICYINLITYESCMRLELTVNIDAKKPLLFDVNI